MQRPGLLPNPNQTHSDPNDEQTHPRFWSTEFMYEDAPPKYVQSHQIINEGLNKFKGMKCELGFDSLKNIVRQFSYFIFLTTHIFRFLFYLFVCDVNLVQIREKDKQGHGIEGSLNPLDFKLF